MLNTKEDEQTTHNGYLFLNILQPYSDEIRKLRLKYDIFTANLPTEITVLGSSGIGPIKAGQKKKTVLSEIEKLVPKISAFEFNFARMNQFPNTSIFYLDPEQREPFENIHLVLKNMKVDFYKNNFSFNPHCTIHSVGNISADNKEILNENIDNSKIQINELVWGEYCFNPFVFKINKTWKI